MRWVCAPRGVAVIVTLGLGAVGEMDDASAAPPTGGLPHSIPAPAPVAEIAAAQASASPSGPLSPVQVKVRAQSRTSYRGLGGQAALLVGRQRFTQFMDEPAWAPPALPEGARIVQWTTASTAQVTDEAGRPAGLFDAGQPVASKDEDGDLQLANLALERTAGGYAPALSPVDIVLPDRLSVPIRLGDDVDIDVGGSDVPSTRYEDKLFFANAETDTDVVLAPLPTGTQVSWQLRSPQSPASLDLDLRAGSDSSVRIGPDGAGAALLDADGASAATVSPVRAWDAAGKPVEAAYAVREGRLIVEVDHRQPGTTYPVMVDPVVDAQTFGAGISGWAYGTWWPSWYVGATSFFSPGLAIHNASSTSIDGLSYGMWYYQAPGISHVSWVDFDDVGFSGSGNNMCYTEGFFNTSDWEQNSYWTDWASSSGRGPYWSCTPTGGPETKAHCVTSDCVGGVPGNRAGLELWAFGTSSRGMSLLFMPAAGVILNDDENPEIDSKGFVNGTTVGAGTSIPFDFRDAGLGTSRVTASIKPGDSWTGVWTGQYIHAPSGSCKGTPDFPCSTSWGHDQFTVGNIPAGSHTVRVSVMDKGGKVTSHDFVVTVPSPPPSTSRPAVSLSGSLWNHRQQFTDHRAEGVYNANHGLSIAVTDSDSPITSVDVKVDDAAASGGHFTPSCSGSGACSASLSWNFASDSYSDGYHVVSIVAHDATGARAPEVFGVYVDRLGTIYHAAISTGDPAAGGVGSGEEWLRDETHQVRHEDAEVTWSHNVVPCSSDVAGCLQERAALDGSLPETLGAASFSIETGTTHDDPRILANAELEADDDPDLGSTIQTGAIADALEVWQVPPPGHSNTYELHEYSGSGEIDFDGNPVVERVWLDGGTKLPLKRTETSDGAVQDTVYYVYDRGRLSMSEVATDFFSVQPSLLGAQTHQTSSVALGAPGSGLAEPVQTHQERLDSAENFREEFGLDSSSSTVEDIVEADESDPTAYAESNMLYGTALTNGEMAEMARREEVQLAAGEFQDLLASEVPAEYGGGFIDQEDGKLTVGFTTFNRRVDDAISDYSAQAGLDQSEINVVPVDTTLDELRTTAAQINEDVESGELDALGVAGAKVNEETNDVDVDVDLARPDPAVPSLAVAQAALVTAYGDVVESEEYTPAAARTRWAAGAGMFDRTDPTSHCTAGFGTHYGGRSYQLTAGHCVIGHGATAWTIKRTASWGRSRVARSSLSDHSVSVLESDSASLIIARRNRSSRVVVADGVGTRNRSYVVNGARIVHQGDRVCQYGWTSHHVWCGTVQSGDVKYDFEDSGYRFTISHGIEVRYKCSGNGPGNQPKGGAVGGDSGGPVYVVSQSERAVVAVGIISAGPLAGCSDGHVDDNATTIGYALKALGGHMELNTHG